MEPSIHLSWSFLQKKGNIAKSNFCKKFHFRCLKGPLPIPTLNASPKFIDLMENNSPIFNNPFPHCTIKIWRKKIFKTGFRKLLIL